MRPQDDKHHISPHKCLHDGLAPALHGSICSCIICLAASGSNNSLFNIVDRPPVFTCRLSRRLSHVSHVSGPNLAFTRCFARCRMKPFKSFNLAVSKSQILMVLWQPWTELRGITGLNVSALPASFIFHVFCCCFLPLNAAQVPKCQTMKVKLRKLPGWPPIRKQQHLHYPNQTSSKQHLGGDIDRTCIHTYIHLLTCIHVYVFKYIYIYMNTVCTYYVIELKLKCLLPKEKATNTTQRTKKAKHCWMGAASLLPSWAKINWQLLHDEVLTRQEGYKPIYMWKKDMVNLHFFQVPPYHELYKVEHRPGLRTDATLSCLMAQADYKLGSRGFFSLNPSCCACTEGVLSYGCLKSNRMLAWRRSSQSPLCRKKE